MHSLHKTIREHVQVVMLHNFLDVPDSVINGEVENIAGQHDLELSALFSRGWPVHHNMIRFQLIGLLQQPIIRQLDYYCRYLSFKPYFSITWNP